MSYVIKDHQGSMYATITGNTVERYSFDAWGRRRNPQTLSYDNVTTSFDRGYTLHEHYDDFGLINMNGCLYNPFAGKEPTAFLFPQFPQNPQIPPVGKIITIASKLTKDTIVSFIPPRHEGFCSSPCSV